MFSLFKPKKKSQPSYESTARNMFTRNNLFVYCIQDIYSFSPGKEKLLKWIEEAEYDVNYSKLFYLHAIRMNKETFTLNHQTKDYLRILLVANYLIGKCSSIIHSNNKKEAEYLINDLVGVVYLLQELDVSLRKGVPLDHKTVINAVFTVHQLLEEKLNVYYQLGSESLSREIQISKQLRLEYQASKEAFNLIIGKPKANQTD